MIVFYIRLCTTIFYMAALLFCLSSLFKKHGWYWILPFFAATASLIDAFSAMYQSTFSLYEIFQTQTIIKALIPAIGALCWLIALAIIIPRMINYKSQKYTNNNAEHRESQSLRQNQSKFEESSEEDFTKLYYQQDLPLPQEKLERNTWETEIKEQESDGAFTDLWDSANQDVNT